MPPKQSHLALLLSSALCVVLHVGCSPEPAPLGPEGERCGELAAFYLGIDAAVVEVTAGDATPGTGKVRIDFRADGAEGVALCHFEGAPGALTATAAFVDENRLRDDQLAAFNAAL